MIKMPATPAGVPAIETLMAEGFDILANSRSKALPGENRYDLDLGTISELWRRGSVVSSWLLDLTVQALAETPEKVLSAMRQKLGGHVELPTGG